METQMKLTRRTAHGILLALKTKVEPQRRASKVEPGSLGTVVEPMELRRQSQMESKVQAGRCLTKMEPMGRESPVEPSGQKVLVEVREGGANRSRQAG